MISAALTSFLTGITEPIEFAFLFVAPVLYAIHALLAGAAYLRGHRARHPPQHDVLARAHRLHRALPALARADWWLVPLGLLWAAMYYAIFRTLILKFDLKTPGRESDDAVQSAAIAPPPAAAMPNDSMAASSSRPSAAHRTFAVSMRASRGCASSSPTTRARIPMRSGRSAPPA